MGERVAWIAVIGGAALVGYCLWKGCEQVPLVGQVLHPLAQLQHQTYQGSIVKAQRRANRL